MSGYLKICFSVILATVLLSTFPSCPWAHVIGGGLNTDISVAPLQMDNGPRWLKAVLSTVITSRNKRMVEETPALMSNGVNNNTAENEGTSTLGLQNIETGKEVKPSTSRLDAGHPFLRAKRQAATCLLPEKIPANISDIITRLNSSQFLGLNPKQPAYTPVPTNQPDGQCPPSIGSWWSNRTEPNLMSTCPWVYTEKDLGEDYFPRYLSEANCLCRDCITANSQDCLELKQNVTVFQRQGCKNGVALLNKVDILIIVGCFCAAIKTDVSTVAPTYTPSN